MRSRRLVPSPRRAAPATSTRVTALYVSTNDCPALDAKKVLNVGGPARRAGSLGSAVRHLRHRPAPRGHRVDLLARVLLHGERDAGAVARDKGREDGSRSVRNSVRWRRRRGRRTATGRPRTRRRDIAVEGGPAVVPLRRRSVIAGSARGHGVRLGRLLLRGRRRRRAASARARKVPTKSSGAGGGWTFGAGSAGRGRAAVGGRDAESRACDRGGALHSPETESRVSARAVVT